MASKRGEEIKVCGAAACRALFDVRPHDIVRVYVLKKTKRTFADLMSHCAKLRLAYHIVEQDELDRVAESQHHEGICILAKVASPTFDELMAEIGREPACLVVLDGLKNPHNLGAILRTAANFGVTAIIRNEEDGRTPPSAHRVAEGGAEVVPVVRVRDVSATVRRLESFGFEVVATAANGRQGLFEHRFSKRTVLILGAERDGVSAPMRRLAKATLAIPGTGDVESLNVSTSAAVVLSERWRQINRRRV